jgi:hypothetical protein
MRTRFYAKCLGYDGQDTILVCKAFDKKEARKTLNSQYKLQAILEVSDTYKGISSVPSYIGTSMNAGAQYHSGNRSSRRGSI